MKNHTTIRLLGPLEIRRDGQSLALPPSKKARALLGYLALSGIAEGREALCDMFWVLPDDPRAALRWALSKLRKLLDTDDRLRLIADRHSVRFDLSDVEVDILALADEVRHAAAPIGAARLIAIRDALDAPLLGGLETAGGTAFKTWLLSEREAVKQLRHEVERQLAEHGCRV